MKADRADKVWREIISRVIATRFNRLLELKAKVLFKTTIPPPAKLAARRFRRVNVAFGGEVKRNYLAFSYRRQSSHQRAVGDFFSGV